MGSAVRTIASSRQPITERDELEGGLLASESQLSGNHDMSALRDRHSFTHRTSLEIIQ